MRKKKEETILYEGFGFPVALVNVPLKFVLGEWVLDINLDKLQMFVVQSLIHKHAPLTGGELSCLRKFLRMSTTAFGKMCGVTHAAVIKWESDKANINPATEIYIRLLVLRHLHVKSEKIDALLNEIRAEDLIKNRKDRDKVIEIDVSEHLLAAS